jgi:outer membrane receptor protein involved in Fe transport
MGVRMCGLALALVLFDTPLVAQETVNSASVSGRVTDPQGAAVPGASVTARQTETNVTRETVTDQDGRFRLPYLKVGPYTITIRIQGFAEVTRALTLTVGSAFELPVSLKLGTLETSVTVSAEAVVLEAARSQIAGTVSQAEVKDLPLNGRNFLDIALLVPGVSPTNVASTQLFAETSAVPGGGLSVGSQRNLSNNFIVDGLSANDDAAALSGIPYGLDAVDQFQVVTSGGQAELGRALGGYFNVVTKSGTNATRGDLYGYFRDASLDARNALFGKRLPLSQQQIGGSAGGPLRRDRTFYFTNLEGRNLNQSGLTTIAAETVQTINARLAAVGYPGAPVTTGVYRSPVKSTHYLGKIDHQVSRHDQFSVRYSLYDVSSQNARGAGGLNAPSASSSLDNVDHTIAFANTWTITPRTVNETRAQVAHGDLKAPASDGVGPAVSIAGLAAFGTSSGSPTRRVNTLYQVVNNLSHQAGAHALRAGIDVLYNDDTITYPRSIRGAYTFSSLANFLAGVYNNNTGFTQTFGTTVISQTNPNAGIYVQDEWKVASGVTLNAGLRYDLQYLQTIRTDRNNVSPRVGFAWSPGVARRRLVRGSGGLFFDRVPLRALANALLSANNTSDVANLRQISISLSPSQTGAPVFPAILAGVVPAVTLPSLTTMNQDMQNAYSRQGSVEVEQRIGERSTVSAGYQYTGGRSLIIAVNQNVPACAAAGTNNGCRPNPAYANNSQYSPAARSSYHGLHLSFVQRPARWGHYRVSYTYSKAMSNVGNFFFSSPIDPFDLSKDWGRSDDDQRHRLVVNGAVTIQGFQLSGLIQAYSALPFNITSGVTTLQGTAGRPVADGAFIPRNAGIGPDFFSTSLRLRRTFALRARFRLEALIEAFNLTNTVNVVTVNGNFGAGAYPSNPSSTFGQATAVNEPRSVQLGLRFKF